MLRVVLLFVYSMARLVLRSIETGEQSTLDDLHRITGDKNFSPNTPEEIVSRLLHTVGSSFLCHTGRLIHADEIIVLSRDC